MAAGDTGFFLLWGFVLVLMVVGFGFEGVRKLRLVFMCDKNFPHDHNRLGLGQSENSKKTTTIRRKNQLEK